MAGSACRSLWKDHRTNISRGSKSRNKVSVGEPAEGSSSVLLCTTSCYIMLTERWFAPAALFSYFAGIWISSCPTTGLPTQLVVPPPDPRGLGPGTAVVESSPIVCGMRFKHPQHSGGPFDFTICFMNYNILVLNGGSLGSSIDEERS
jgi:hypothetical protein